MISGGIAAIKAPLLARSLRRYQANVIAYVSEEALRYTTIDALEWATTNPVVRTLSAQAEHLSKSNPIDIFLLAPATYNTINKIRHGIADTPLTTTLATALGRMEKNEAKVFIAPTMHGDFHNSILQESLEFLRGMGVILCPPRDDYGKHNLPDPEVLAAYVCHFSTTTALTGKKILFTIEDTGHSSIQAKLKLAQEFYLRGASVTLVGNERIPVPDYLESIESPNSVNETQFDIVIANTAAPKTKTSSRSKTKRLTLKEILPNASKGSQEMSSQKIGEALKNIESLLK
jgi:phosphopantothenoylcysteine decarboxylase/phosphopantothenate--cysteine ligase